MTKKSTEVEPAAEPAAPETETTPTGEASAEGAPAPQAEPAASEVETPSEESPAEGAPAPQPEGPAADASAPEFADQTSPDAGESRTAFVQTGRPGDACTCPDGRKGTIRRFDSGLVCIPDA
jgi:hypothetical protein